MTRIQTMTPITNENLSRFEREYKKFGGCWMMAMQIDEHNHITAGKPYDNETFKRLCGNITILGYHFDVSGVPVTDASGNEKGETTTVRVKNTFGDTAGVLTTEYFHIASLDEEGQDSAYPHAAELVEGEEYIYLCGGPSPTYFDVSDVESTFTNEDINLIKWEEVKDAEEGDITSITYAPVHGRSFGISFRATFVQSSEVPKI